MGWLIALAVILLLLSVPLGLHGRYDGKTARLQAVSASQGPGRSGTKGTACGTDKGAS